MQVWFTSRADIFRTTHNLLTMIIRAILIYFQGWYFQDNLQTSYDDYSCSLDLLPGLIFLGQLKNFLRPLFVQVWLSSRADIFKTTYEHLKTIIRAGLTHFQGRYFQNTLLTSYEHYLSRFDLLPGPIFSGQLTNFLWWLFVQGWLTSSADIFKTIY